MVLKIGQSLEVVDGCLTDGRQIGAVVDGYGSVGLIGFSAAEQSLCENIVVWIEVGVGAEFSRCLLG